MVWEGFRLTQSYATGRQEPKTQNETKDKRKPVTNKTASDSPVAHQRLVRPKGNATLNVIGQRIRMTKEASERASRQQPREGTIVGELEDYWFLVQFDGYKHPVKVPGEQWELA